MYRPFQCSQCVKAFLSKNNLRTHLKTHTGEKPYHCDQCGRCFSEKRSLARHLGSHTCKKTYQCTQCEKAFSDEINLKEHIWSHTGEKPYRCTYCDKAFSHRVQLIRHTMTHNEGKPYQCNQCGKSFSDDRTFKSHLIIRTKENLEQTYICKEIDTDKLSEPKYKENHVKFSSVMVQVEKVNNKISETYNYWSDPNFEVKEEPIDIDENCPSNFSEQKVEIKQFYEKKYTVNLKESKVLISNSARLKEQKIEIKEEPIDNIYQ